jgi:hypothetical protein
MDESLYKQLFLLFDEFKKNKEVNFDKIPNNLIGYIVYNWFIRRKSVKKIGIAYFKDKEKNMTDLEILRNIKYKKPDKAIELVDEIYKKYLSKINDFKALIKTLENNGSILRVDIEDNKKFINIMSLVIVIESMSSDIYDIELRERLMQNIKEICHTLDIDLNDVFYFSKYEDEIIKLYN